MNTLFKNNILSHIKEDIERLLKQGEIFFDSPLEKVFEEYKKDLKCELKDSGFDPYNEEHAMFIKKTIQSELDRRVKEKFTLVDEDGGALLNLNAETSEDAIKELESRGILIDVSINEPDKELICLRPIEYDYDSEMEEFWKNQDASKNENGLDDVAKEKQEREAYEQEIQHKIQKFVSYVDANCSKKITSATVKNHELTVEIYGGLDDMQIEKIQDNFNWINGLVFNNDKLVVFHLDM